MAYASNTSVSIGRTRDQIEHVLKRYGADGFAYQSFKENAQVMFAYDDWVIRFALPLPPIKDFEHSSGGRYRNPDTAEKYRDQAVRSRWRALLLVINAKLEAIDVGITSFEEEFLAHLVTPSGSTVASWLLPRLKDARVSGEMPKLLEAGLPDIEDGRG